MKFVRSAFNLYFLVLSLGLLSGCQTSEERTKQQTLSTFRIHLEVPADNPQTPEDMQRLMGRNQMIEIAGVRLFVNSQSFIDEASVENVTLAETMDDGFAVKVEFTEHGKLILDQTTLANRNRRYAIHTRFGVDEDVTERWLAAPLISAGISDGVIVFTPNATREETEEFVLGLSNAATKRKRKEAPFNLLLLDSK